MSPKPHSRRGANDLHILSRRLLLVFAFACVLVLVLIIAFPSRRDALSLEDFRSLTRHTAKHSGNDLHNLPLPALWNPTSNVHVPPEHAPESRSGDTAWYNSMKWLSPFSSDITLDADRIVLPPSHGRTPIYTYYDPGNKPAKVVEAEKKLVLSWQRAWWAQGFRPVVLGKADTLKSALLYKRLRQLQLKPVLEQEFERWLAWEYMGGGILTNWLLYPMAQRDDRLLAELRHARFPRLTRFEELGTGLFAGPQSDIHAVLDEALQTKPSSKVTQFLDVLPRDAMHVESYHESIAFYDLPTINSRYGRVAAVLSEDLAPGLASLLELINGHLHYSWRQQHSGGVAILKPWPDRMTAITEYALSLGTALASCPKTPLPKTCPPNQLSCRPCGPEDTIPVTTPSTWNNKTDQLVIGTVSHPVTFNHLHYLRNTLDTSFIRRKSPRDQYIFGVTRDLLGENISGPQRLTRFKEAVASDFGASHSLWLTAEREEPLELEWVLGFRLPDLNTVELPSAQQVIDPMRKVDQPIADPPSHEELLKERALMGRAKAELQSKGKKERAMVSMVEAWNMADTEAWRFVRAYTTRAYMERKLWREEEERSSTVDESTVRSLDAR